MPADFNPQQGLEIHRPLEVPQPHHCRPAGARELRKTRKRRLGLELERGVEHHGHLQVAHPELPKLEEVGAGGGERNRRERFGECRAFLQELGAPRPDGNCGHEQRGGSQNSRAVPAAEVAGFVLLRESRRWHAGEVGKRVRGQHQEERSAE